MLKPLTADGYKMKDSAVAKISLAYADDLSLITSSVAKMQKALGVTEKCLDWTETMKAKPQKCVSYAAKQFDPRNVHKLPFERYSDTRYAPYDPLLTIGGKRITFIVTPCTRCSRGANCPTGTCCPCSSCHTEPDPKSLFHDHFKFLGRRTGVELNEIKTADLVRKKFKADMDLVDNTGLNGLMKLWLYEHFVISRLSWPFIVHDFSFSFAIELEKAISVRLKKWAGLFRGADTGTLFRSRENFGLQLTSVSDHFVLMQLIKCTILSNSNDADVVEIYRMQTARKSTFKKKWSANEVAAKMAEQAEFNQRFQSQATKLGLGHGSFSNNPTPDERRKQVSRAYAIAAEEKRIAHATTLSRQGNWTTFKDGVRCFDLSWNNLIYGPGPKVISFVLNALINSVRTPDMLKLWGYKQSASCPLCDRSPCTIHHILSNCQYALNQRRYNWRHDSVLKNIELALVPHVRAHNASFKPKPKTATLPLNQFFVKKGSSHRPKRPKSEKNSLLDGANDWEVLVDYDTANIVFPPSICATTSRPDIVIWSSLSRKVIMIELTCPAEEGIEAAALRKETRYEELQAAIKAWGECKYFTIEVGARGLVGLRVHNVLIRIGLTPSAAKALCRRLSEVVARASYALYLAHDSKTWAQSELLVISDPAPSTASCQQTDVGKRVGRKRAREPHTEE